jgi:hypothetical protein
MTTPFPTAVSLTLIVGTLIAGYAVWFTIWRALGRTVGG